MVPNDRCFIFRNSITSKIMELTIAIIIIVIVLVFPYGLLIHGYNENTKLTEENTQLKCRLEAIQLHLSDAKPEKRDVPPIIEKIDPEEPLTPEKIALAIQDRHYGFVREKREDVIYFDVKDNTYSIWTERLPRFILALRFTVDAGQYDLDCMRQAAHLMSDNIIMVKADLNDTPDEDGGYGLSFYLAAMDRNYPSFSQNLDLYIDIIEDGRRNLAEQYDKLVKAKQDPVPTLTALTSGNNKETKIIS